MVAMSDLTERPAEVASAAIANERPALEHRPDELKGTMLEFQLPNNSDAIDSTCWNERRGVHPRRRELAV
jgi:hypothetical protein